MALKYSEQATVLIEGSKDFNKDDFECWFSKNLVVGSNNILEYIMFRRKVAKEKKRLEDLENGNSE